jgi:hypothetical protein
MNPGVPMAIVDGGTSWAQDMPDTVVMWNSMSLTKDSRSGALAGFTRCTSMLRFLMAWYSSLLRMISFE